MRKISAIIVDDEKHARHLLDIELKEHLPQIEVTEHFKNILEAEDFLQNNETDIMFLDIEMPGGNGLELLKKFPKRNFYPIIVTSHIEYAIDAIKEEAFDYLLKPVNKDALINSVSRVSEKLSEIKTFDNRLEKNRLQISDRKSTYFLKIGEIIYLKAAGSYTEIVTRDQQHLVSKNLKSIHSQLDEQLFCRVNHSSVINIQFVDRVDKERDAIILESGMEFSLSVRKRDDFFEKMKRV